MSVKAPTMLLMIQDTRSNLAVDSLVNYHEHIASLILFPPEGRRATVARVKKWFAQMRADLWQGWFDRAEKLSKQLEACRINGVVVVDEDWETEDPEDLRYKVELPCLTFKQVEEVVELLNRPLPTKSL